MVNRQDFARLCAMVQRPGATFGAGSTTGSRDVRTALTVLSAACLWASQTLAENLKITNKAGGVACYETADLMTAHGALGFYNVAKVKLLIVQDRCFIIPKHWKASLLDRQRILGADVDMLKVRIYSPSESRFAWALKANFETAFGNSN